MALRSCNSTPVLANTGEVTDDGFCHCGACFATVEVLERRWPGTLKPGGLAFVKNRHDDGSVDVKFVHGGKAIKVPQEFVICASPDVGRKIRGAGPVAVYDGHTPQRWTRASRLAAGCGALPNKENTPRVTPAKRGSTSSAGSSGGGGGAGAAQQPPPPSPMVLHRPMAKRRCLAEAEAAGTAAAAAAEAAPAAHAKQPRRRGTAKGKAKGSGGLAAAAAARSASAAAAAAAAASAAAGAAAGAMDTTPTNARTIARPTAAVSMRTRKAQDDAAVAAAAGARGGVLVKPAPAAAAAHGAQSPPPSPETRDFCRALAAVKDTGGNSISVQELLAQVNAGVRARGEEGEYTLEQSMAALRKLGEENKVMLTTERGIEEGAQTTVHIV